MKGLARQHLQALQVNPVTLVELNIALGKVIPHHAHQFNRAKETGRHRRVAGRAAQQSRVLRLGVLMESSAVEPTIRTLIII